MKKSLIIYLAAMLPWLSLFAADQSHSTSDNLKGAREELNVLLERYTEQHPAVIAKRMQFTELEKTVK